jgi:hypothetical protein
MGSAISTDYYINGNYSLRLIVDDPDSPQNSAGLWPAALPAIARNFFAFQPWPTTSNTMATENAAFMTLANAALSSPSVNPRFFHYQTWPSQVRFGDNYSAYWALPVVNADSTFVVQKKQFHDFFYARILAQLPNTLLIPAGDVLAEIDRLARLGQVPGISTVFEMYRDVQHLSDAGRFAASSTRLAVMLNRYPTSLNTRALYAQGLDGAPLTDVLADVIEQVVWAVVSGDTRTGVTP